MNRKFRLGKSVFFILCFVFIFGLFLEVIRSNYALTLGYKQFQDSAASTEKEQAVSQSSFTEKPNFLLIYDEESQLSQSVTTNVEQTLTYMKKAFQTVPVQSLTEAFDAYNTVIVNFEALEKFDDITKLDQYVANGGTVLFTVRPAIDDAFIYLYRKLGIYEFGGFVTTAGIQVADNLWPNQQSMKIDGSFITNSSLFVGLEERSNIYAQSSDDVPLLWNRNYKEGTFITFNGTMLDKKSARGLLTSAISLVEDDFLYPIMNVKMSFIDGFPSEIPSGRNQAIFEAYKKDIVGFYRDIWWPAIQKTAMDDELSYTSGFMPVNDHKVNAPFSDGLLRQDFVKYVRELMKIDGELALAGYNNVPLFVGENYWESVDDIYQVLDNTDQFMDQSFPNYSIKTYYPPDLKISEEGLQAVQQVYPSIENVVVDYAEQASEFKQENNWTYVPITSSGYSYSEQTEWVIANAIYSIGVYAHQISPWEVLTSQASWEELASNYETITKDIQEKYPWLRSMTSAEAGSTIKEFLATDVRIEQTDNGLSVALSRDVDEFYFFLRTDKTVQTAKSYTVELVDPGVYLITAKQATFEIRLEGSS